VPLRILLFVSQAAITSSLYIATGVLSEILTNNAAAALMYPIAAAAGDRLGARTFYELYMSSCCGS